MDKSVLGVGIIGCGTFCGAYLSTLGSTFTNCKVVACSDIDLDRAYAVAKEWNIPHPCSTDELLADPAVDMAVIVTGPNSHYPLILQCLRAGKHVYCEKPMAITLEQCDEIVALAEEKGLHVTVAPDTILDARVQTIREALDDGLIGTPNELKLKYLADNDFKDLSGEALKQAISESIKKKGDDLKGNMASQGTTPRQLTDLIGSLCDLTSGSGDKGTPVVLVQGYFDNYTNS